MFQESKSTSFTPSVTVPMPTDYGTFEMSVYTEHGSGREHIALTLGKPALQSQPLVRIHSECATGDLFASRRCDCGAQLQYALRRISEEGCGVLLYLRQEGRGIGLSNKLRAYQLQDQGLDTVDANLALGFAVDARRYDLAAAILRTMEIDHVRLLTNNPDKVSALAAEHICVDQRVPIEVGQQRDNLNYLTTKKQRLGHYLGGSALSA